MLGPIITNIEESWVLLVTSFLMQFFLLVIFKVFIEVTVLDVLPNMVRLIQGVELSKEKKLVSLLFHQRRVVKLSYSVEICLNPVYCQRDTQ